MNKVRENAFLKEADLQGRSVRKWTDFNMFMRVTTPEQHGVWFCSEGWMDVGPWSALDFPITPLFRKFLWWLATPSVVVNPDVGSQSPMDKNIIASGPRGYSYTYTRVVSYNLLSFVEEMEWIVVEKGKYAVSGDVVDLRKGNGTVMKNIAL